MLKMLVKFQIRANQIRGERGVAATEYGLMIAGISIAIIGVGGTLGRALHDAFYDVVMDPNMGWAPVAP